MFDVALKVSRRFNHRTMIHRLVQSYLGSLVVVQERRGGSRVRAPLPPASHAQHHPAAHRPLRHVLLVRVRPYVRCRFRSPVPPLRCLW
eukprot:5620503-Prymnesium_polylepis.1